MTTRLEPLYPRGPLFSRWLPNGEQDAVTLHMDVPNVRLRVWFERRGFVGRDGWIEYDPERREVPDDATSRQFVLEAGALYGRLELEDVDQGEYDAVTQSRTGSPEYTRIGRRVAQDLLTPTLSAFLNYLRTRSGQFWIPEFGAWDSRNASLGGYCQNLRLRWSSDEGMTWQDFVPDQPMINITVRTSDFTQYMSREYWTQLVEAEGGGIQHSIAADTLSLAFEFLQEGNFRQAMVESVTTAEVAVDELLSSRLGSTLVPGSDQFRNMGINVKLLVVAGLLQVEPAEIQNALDVIKRRNDVIHEGVDPSRDSDIHNKLLRFMRVVSRIIASYQPGPKFLFPDARHGNQREVNIV